MLETNSPKTRTRFGFLVSALCEKPRRFVAGKPDCWKHPFRLLTTRSWLLQKGCSGETADGGFNLNPGRAREGRGRQLAESLSVLSREVSEALKAATEGDAYDRRAGAILQEPLPGPV